VSRLIALTAVLALVAPASAVRADDEDPPPTLAAQAIAAVVWVAPPLALEAVAVTEADTGRLEGTEDDTASAGGRQLGTGPLQAEGPAAQATLTRAGSRAEAMTLLGSASIDGAGPAVDLAGLRVEALADCTGTDAAVTLSRLVVDGEVLVDEETSIPPNTRITTGGPRGPLVVLLNEQVEVRAAAHGLAVRGVVVYSSTGDVALGAVTVSADGCEAVGRG
jgi:hypothetical protein